ncbi:membrane protein [Cypionkella aquatica]|uniref:Membrane protein n=1 Tax=Cypionkella aquatica TaxID=1756042 RepID=A0AA37TQK7_9RHOB|nr:OmpA family protein [Cypionkella aquatica]GLS85243.1 membrane protein [Cypionkella aquatica]
MKTSPFKVAFCLAASLSAKTAQAAPQLQLQFPGPSETTSHRSEVAASYRLAIGPFQGGTIATELTEGSLSQTAWKIATPEGSTLAMVQSLRAQIAAAGYKVMFECETEACGGYDFRYGTEVVAEPDMHIDLGDFRYLAAERIGTKGKEYLGLMVSKSPDNGYVQLTQIGGDAAAQLATSSKSAEPPQATSFALKPAITPQSEPTSTKEIGQTLDQGQALVLEDLVFSSGSAVLSDGKYASLVALAGWLAANPSQTVTLVGHTDDSGGLAGNITLSKKRAESVRQTLIAQYGVVAAQISANGVGPLAPRASNLTPDGQQQNRRVEVVLTPTPN